VRIRERDRSAFERKVRPKIMIEAAEVELVFFFVLYRSLAHSQTSLPPGSAPPHRRNLRPFFVFLNSQPLRSKSSRALMRLARGSSVCNGAASRGGGAAARTATRAKVLLPSPLSSKAHASSSSLPSSSTTKSSRPLVAAAASPGEGLAQATSPIQYPLTGAPRESKEKMKKEKRSGER
jgi:hypothetical protein